MFGRRYGQPPRGVCSVQSWGKVPNGTLALKKTEYSRGGKRATSKVWKGSIHEHISATSIRLWVKTAFTAEQLPTESGSQSPCQDGADRLREAPVMHRESRPATTVESFISTKRCSHLITTHIGRLINKSVKLHISFNHLKHVVITCITLTLKKLHFAYRVHSVRFSESGYFP
jgi:hypothetical protein